MKKYYSYDYSTYLADMFTPVGLFQKVRSQYENSVLLESSDYNSPESSRSFICFGVLEGITLEKDNVFISEKGQETRTVRLKKKQDWKDYLKGFLGNIVIDTPKKNQTFNTQGVYGYTSYETVEYFDTIELKNEKEGYDIPVAMYFLYQYCIVFDHFTQQLHFTRLSKKGNKKETLLMFKDVLGMTPKERKPFSVGSERESSITDEEYKAIISKAKKHCKRGDVFQVVPSRGFSKKIFGDNFDLYRSMRSVSPTPFQFYLDYNNFQIMGCSPEAQLVVTGEKAEIHPIAGTFKRTADDRRDMELSEKLKKDKKETAEHMMLVDLARNDMSIYCYPVVVEKFKEVQFFSHVIHLTSVVSGKIKEQYNGIDVFCSTFPAGTLSGAPKYRAMQIIDDLEDKKRQFYSGAVGFFGCNGDVKQAITIRSVLATNGAVYYQAGAGVVFYSDEESEKEEVFNKLRAIETALEYAQKIETV